MGRLVPLDVLKPIRPVGPKGIVVLFHVRTRTIHRKSRVYIGFKGPTTGDRFRLGWPELGFVPDNLFLERVMIRQILNFQGQTNVIVPWMIVHQLAQIRKHIHRHIWIRNQIGVRNNIIWIIFQQTLADVRHPIFPGVEAQTNHLHIWLILLIVECQQRGVSRVVVHYDERLLTFQLAHPRQAIL